MFYLNGTDNYVAKLMKPRTNTYWLALQTPSTLVCNGVASNLYTVTILPRDKSGPIEIVGDGDSNLLAFNMTTTQWDRIV